MHKALLILGILILTGLTALDVHRFFTTDEGIQYYASHPQRLLWVSGIAVLGGILAFVFSCLSEDSQRVVKLLLIGGFAVLVSCLTVLLGCVFSLALSGSAFTDSGELVWIGIALFSAGLIAVVQWMEFRRVWKQRNRTSIRRTIE